MKEKRGVVMLKLLLGGTAVFSGICLYNGNHRFYSEIVMPTARLLDAEMSHNLAIKLASNGILPRVKLHKDEALKCDLLGLKFDSPLGLAAGFDKDAECFDSLKTLGFGFLEIGTVTPKPQFGNPKPRLFRLIEDKAIINRFGFNSSGVDYVKNKLAKRKWAENIVGVNLGVNKNSSNALEDYQIGISELGPYADYLVINVSSPNTPGLRSLQTKKHFDTLLKSVMSERNKLKSKPPLFVKIAPDLTIDELKEICQSVMLNKIDGLIVCNTTVSRKNLNSPENLREEVGGLSGAPLFETSNEMIKSAYNFTRGTVPIIGVGGIFSGQDVVEKMKHGASLVQMYTGFVYQGSTCVNEINKEISQELEAENVTNINEVVGQYAKLK